MRWWLATFVLGTFVLGFILGGTAAKSQPAAAAEPWVGGIGGVFFKADDPARLRAWYREHLGIGADGQGVNFVWREWDDANVAGYTVWSAFPRDTRYFGAGDQQVMINYRVRDLDALLAKLEDEGVRRDGGIDEYWYGRFAWIFDGEGNRVELWEPARMSIEEFERRLQAQ